MKMNERKVGITLIIVGLTVIVSCELNEEVQTVELTKVPDLEVGKRVRSEGTIESLNKKNSVTFIELEGISTDIVYFGEKQRKNLKRGKRMFFTGRLKLYHGRKEIVIDELDVR